jgi:dynein heavy chain, axonemal
MRCTEVRSRVKNFGFFYRFNKCAHSNTCINIHTHGYTGRVSDDMDRRILKTYLEEYMGDFLFDDCDKFNFSKVGFDYCLPEWGEIGNYTDMVESLPLTNSPAVFGLHPNAEIGYYTSAVKSMWVDLISLQPRRAGAGEGMSR